MKTSILFEPYSLGKFRLKNRIVLAPMTRGRAGPERVPNDMMAEYYHQRASAGLIITEATVISPQGIGWIDSPGIYTDEMVAGWRKVTDRLKADGTPAVLQLWHCGRASHSDFHGGDLPVSASAVKLKGDHIHTPLGKKSYETPRPLSVDEIRATIDDYRQAAEAVFDGVPLDESAGGDKEAHIDGLIAKAKQLLGDNRYRFVFELGLNVILDDIRDDLHLFGVDYQEWYSERSLVESGAVNKVIDRLRDAGHLYEKAGAWWFRSTAFGDAKDRVVVRENGQTRKLLFSGDIGQWNKPRPKRAPRKKPHPAKSGR